MISLYGRRAWWDGVTAECEPVLGKRVQVLSIGAALLGASYVLGVDVDEDALQIAAVNVSQSELTNIDLIQVPHGALFGRHAPQVGSRLLGQPFPHPLQVFLLKIVGHNNFNAE